MRKSILFCHRQPQHGFQPLRRRPPRVGKIDLVCKGSLCSVFTYFNTTVCLNGVYPLSPRGNNWPCFVTRFVTKKRRMQIKKCMRRFPACQKRYIISSMSPCGGGRVGATIFLMIFIYHESGDRNALMPRGHFLLSSHKRKQKEPREHISRDPLALRHCGSLFSKATLEPVRRDARKLASGSNTSDVSFLAGEQAKRRLFSR